MLVNSLSNYCSELVNDFAVKVHALDVEKYEDKKFTRWTITLNIMSIDFMYIKKSCVACPVSTLYSRLYLNKNASIFYHIPELLDYVVIDESNYYFSYIESKERMKQCFDLLSDFYLKNIQRLKEISMDSVIQNELKNRKILDMKNSLKIKDEYEKEYFDDEQIIWYNLLLSHEENIILYKYTRSMVKYDIDKKDGITYLKNFIICYGLFAIIFFVIGYIIIELLNKGAIYSSVAPASYSLVAAVLPAIFGCIALRRKLACITRRKDLKQALAFDELVNGNKTNIFANICFGLSFIIALCFVIWLPFISVRFYDDYLLYNEGEAFLSFKTERLQYEQLKDIYYVEGRYNIYGDYIDRGSYIIVFKDGKELDLDGFSSIQDTEKNILPIFDKNKEDVYRIKTIEDIKK